VEIIPSTSYVLYDEPCFRLAEVNLQSPGSRGWRRYQVVYVIRNDRLAEYRKDLGPAKKFNANQFQIPGGGYEDNGRMWIEETVGRLMEIADTLRSRPVEWYDVKVDDLLLGYRYKVEASKN